MAVEARIRGRKGEPLDLLTNGRVGVASLPVPPGDWTQAEVEQRKTFVQFFTDGSTADMTIDGSTTAVDYYIQAATDRLIWVDEVRLIHHDSQMNLSGNEVRRFGSSAASPGLTNGVSLLTQQGGQETDLFVSVGSGGIEGVQAVSDYYSYADTVFGITDGVSAGTDLLVVTLKLSAPVGLYPGGTDKIIVRIQDDLTSMTLFKALAIGRQELL